MPFPIEAFGVVVIIIWLSVLTFFSTRMIFHYNRLTKNTNGTTVKSVLDSLLDNLDKAHKDIDFLKKQCDKIEKEGFYHIQKIGLLRFNPFKDTGGDQSFILALLDGQDTGVVISGLYSRSGTRWYAKKVAEGKGIEHELSDEEKKAVREAKRINEIRNNE